MKEALSDALAIVMGALVVVVFVEVIRWVWYCFRNRP